MKIYHIVAHDESRVIGSDGEIPWSIPEDQQRFREITMGHAVMMGRHTAENIGRPLEGRFNIVLSSDSSFSYDGDDSPSIEKDESVIWEGEETGLMLVDGISRAFRAAEDEGYRELYVIGGQEVYERTLSDVDVIRKTVVHREVDDGDTFYPPLDETWTPFYTEPNDSYSYVDYCHER